MPAVVESPPVARIDRQLAHAAGRIRATDVLTGILAIVVMTLCYAAVMILMDRTYSLPGWVRQLGLLGWLGLAGVTAYRLILRPFGQRVNPLYVAKQVESAIPDAKNVVVNYVDLKDANLPTSVRDAVAGRASAEVTDSDVQKAGESRRLVTLGVASAVLAVVLAVMFLVFSPAQFLSLAKRTFRPFAAVEIVSKTRLSITFPSDPNLTVTAGQPVVLQVALDGRLPSTDGEDRVRLLLRHNNEDPNYEAIPFEPGGTNREFHLKVPEHLVQNGFWYKVAGGDGETPEYRVTVRLRPLVLGVSVTYEYPEYLRMPKETIDRPHIEAYRGTKITVAAKTNRPLQSGKLTFDGKPDINPGTVSPDDAESIRYQFTVGESGVYHLYFTATDGETNLDPPAYRVKVIVDNPPTVVIAKPEPEEIPLPANGQLAIDAVANDDIGLSKLTIQLRKVGPQPQPLQGKPYALQLKREDDKSFPTQVELKDSVVLAELKTEAGQPVSLAEGDVIEYWIEAVDNCGVPAPQTGKSANKRVKILPPEVKPEQKQELEKKTEARKNEEKKQQQQQQQKFEKEQRPPPPGQKDKGEQNPNEQPGEQKPGEKQPGEQQQTGEQKPGEQKPGEKQPGEQKPGENKPGEQQQPGEQKPGEQKPGEQKPGEQKQPGEQQPMPGGAGEQTPEQKAKNEQIEKQANDVAKEIEKQNQNKEGGTGQQQQQPMAEPKGGDESHGGAKPQAPPEGAGNQQKPNDTKPDPKNPEQGQPGGEAKPGQSDSKTGESKPGAEAGTSKPMGGESKPQSGNAGQKPTPEQMKEIGDAARDLNSNDPAKREAAEKKLDGMVGKDARQQAQKEANQLKDDLNSKDPATKAAAEKKLKDMADQIANAGGEQKPQPQQGGSGQKPTPEQLKEMTDAAKDLNSNDPQKQQAARDKLDNMMGKENREKAEKLANDLKSNDQKTRENAEKQLKDMADQMANAGGENKPQPGQKGSDGPKQTPQQQKENEKAIKDLASDDAEAKKKAQDTLDKNIGKEKRKEAEKHVSDSKSNNPMVRNEAEQKLDELAGKGKEEQGGDGQPKQKGMSPEEAQKLAEKAKDLASKDEQKRKDAEKELDDKIGKENREKLQQTMNDLNSGDPKKMEEAQKQIEDWKKQAQEQGGKPNENWRPGGFGPGKPGGDPLKDNPADRLKAHELTLKTLKDAMKDKKQVEKLGYTQEEFDRMVKAFEDRVKDERKAIEVTAKSNPNATPPKAINVNQGPDKLGVRGAEGTGPQGSSAGTAPPGYSDASRKFGEAAAKKKPKGEGN